MAFQTYKGVYKVKNPLKYAGRTELVIYRSGWEKAAFIYCDQNEQITSWSSEEVVIPYLCETDKRYHRYFMDLKIVYADGNTLLVEIKPLAQCKPPTGKRTRRFISEALTYVKNQGKWSAATKYATERGWKFVIWTEKDLTALGILKKQPGTLKKMTPYRRKPVKR